MDPIAAKYLGAGLACIGMGTAAIGVANVFGQFLIGAMRNPSAAGAQRPNLFLGFALAACILAGRCPGVPAPVEAAAVSVGAKPLEPAQ